jgi:hypothetical protein
MILTGFVFLFYSSLCIAIGSHLPLLLQISTLPISYLKGRYALVSQVPPPSSLVRVVLCLVYNATTPQPPVHLIARNYLLIAHPPGSGPSTMLCTNPTSTTGSSRLWDAHPASGTGSKNQTIRFLAVTSSAQVVM